MTQKRAKVGGEYGANGDWYEGGKFISTTKRPKQHKKKFSPTGKVKIDFKTWGCRIDTGNDDTFAQPLYPVLAGHEKPIGNFEFFELNSNVRGYVEERQNDIDAWNEGYRWFELDCETRKRTGKYFK